jgi:phenylacetic acid degradation operon negative regulatory protein
VIVGLRTRAPTGTSLRDLPASHLLITLYRDYWYGSEEFVPSRSLVALLGEFGVNEPAARAALSRLARGGWLEGRRQGRRTAYRLDPRRAAQALAEGRRTVLFGTELCRWDGQWTCVAFSVPEADRRRRPALRRRLRALRLGPLFDGLWITPRAPIDAIDRSLTELGIVDAAVFRVTEVPRPAGIDLLDAWDLDELRAGYDALVARLDRLADRAERGEVPVAEALVTRSDLMARWRALVRIDPRLPDELLPDDWPLRRARQLVVETYDALGPLGQARARELVGALPPGAAPRYHRAADRLRTDADDPEDDHA